MSQNPLVLLATFLLELAGLAALGLFGWSLSDGLLRLVPAVAIPVAAAAIWGIFRVPGDPTDAVVAVPGPVRLAIELGFFGSAVVGLRLAGAADASTALLVAVVVVEALSWDRLLRLIANRPPGA